MCQVKRHVHLGMREIILKNNDNTLNVKTGKNDNTIFDNHILTSSRENHILIFGLISLIQTLFLSSFIFFAAISNSSTNFLFSVAALLNACPLATISSAHLNQLLRPCRSTQRLPGPDHLLLLSLLRLVAELFQSLP